jgi:two-component system, sensor histidine kinase RegB
MIADQHKTPFSTNGDISGDAMHPARVRLRTLILIRWIAVAGQLVSLLTVHFTMGFQLPIVPALGAVGVSAAINVAAMTLRPAATRLSERDAALYLGYDVLQLAVLVGLTGGIANPFAILFLVPVTISATILPLRATWALSALVLACVSVLAIYHWPLPWGNEPMLLPPLYLAGLWVAMMVSTVVIAVYTARVSAEARNMAGALTATQMALAREQRLSAIGALAAAAAHQLGTPLGTIAIAANELARELPEDGTIAEDALLIRDEVGRCREILGRLSALGSGEAEEPYGRIPATTLVEAAAEPHRRDSNLLVVEVGAGVSGPEPLMPRRAEIVHGLGNILENAFQLARDLVEVEVSWNTRTLSIEIRDDGPGFPPAVLPRLGEPYVSGRLEPGGLGLGVFIAKTLLERTGATLAFSNGNQHGARVRVVWPRGTVDALAADAN